MTELVVCGEQLELTLHPAMVRWCLTSATCRNWMNDIGQWGGADEPIDCPRRSTCQSGANVPAKAEILERLGERAVLVPSLFGEALSANDRIKLRLSLLQEAGLQAQAPSRAPRHFEAEGRAAGLAEPKLDTFVIGAKLVGPRRIFVPGVGSLLSGISADLDTMLAPIRAVDGEGAAAFAERSERLKTTVPPVDDDQLDLSAIDSLASTNRAAGDSVHLLVMDFHKALNQLTAETAVKTLDGAKVHALAAWRQHPPAPPSASSA